MRMITTFIFVFISLTVFAQDKGMVIHQKNPAQAFIYSALIPGLGQMYNEQVPLGLITIGTEMVLVGTGVAFASDGSYTPATSNFFFTVAGVIYIAQLIHAPLTADAYNKKNGLKFQQQWAQHIDVKGLGLAYRF